MRRKILYADVPGFKPLPSSHILELAAFECEIIAVTDINAALKTIDNCHDIELLATNAPSRILAEHFRARRPLHGKLVLMTDLPMEAYARALDFEEDRLVDHLIAHTTELDWAVNELRCTLQKILRADLFGIHKYLLPTAPVQVRPVTDAACREGLNKEVMRLADTHRLASSMAKLAYGISEELLMNAIFDAPLAGGRAQPAPGSRPQDVVLAPHEYATLEFGCDGRCFAIGVRDPFGALQRQKFYEYIKKVLRRTEGSGIIDKKKGGAGLGLFKVLYSSHALICNSAPGQQTEVIALLNIHAPLRDFSKMPRSIHFFSL